MQISRVSCESGGAMISYRSSLCKHISDEVSLISEVNIQHENTSKRYENIVNAYRIFEMLRKYDLALGNNILRKGI